MMKFMLTGIMAFVTMLLIAKPVYTFNVSGVVVTNEGSGIKGVMVRLGKADITTITAPDGSFTINDEATRTKYWISSAINKDPCMLLMEQHTLAFIGTEKMVITVTAYDGCGKRLLCHRNTTAAGYHSIGLPHFPAGIHLYCITVNHDCCTFRTVDGFPVHRRMMVLGNSIPRKLQATSIGSVDDAILFTKTGYKLHRLPLQVNDTTGIRITLIPLDTGSVTDVDGNVYLTVRIGNQVWTIENLRTTKLNDGTAIPQVTDNTTWSRQGSAGYCFYDNTTDTAAQKKWGALYNWNAVNTGKLAPAGWHVATDADWDILQNYCIANGYNDDGTLDENRLAKSLSAKTDWTQCAENGAIGNNLNKNNASGFSALPGGYRYYDGSFTEQLDFGYWWTATQRDAMYAWYRCLWSINYDLYRTYRVKSIGCSVRLVKNN